MDVLRKETGRNQEVISPSVAIETNRATTVACGSSKRESREMFDANEVKRLGSIRGNRMEKSWHMLVRDMS